MAYDLEIITADSWKELIPLTDQVPELGKVELITIHHTNSNPLHPLPEKVRLNNLLQFHISDRGWNDIGYHFLISNKGQVFEGRNLSYQGAHVEGFNKGNIGIVVIGDYNIERVRPRVSIVLRNLIEELLKQFNLKKDSVKGHRDFKEKLPGSCPGDFLYQWIMEFRNEKE